MASLEAWKIAARALDSRERSRSISRNDSAERETRDDLALS